MKNGSVQDTKLIQKGAVFDDLTKLVRLLTQLGHFIFYNQQMRMAGLALLQPVNESNKQMSELFALSPKSTYLSSLIRSTFAPTGVLTVTLMRGPKLFKINSKRSQAHFTYLQ